MAEKRTGIAWLTHAYMNLWVEGLRLFMDDKKYIIPGWVVGLFGWPDSAKTEGKDKAYLIGHVIVYGHVPVILIGLAIGGYMLFA